MFNKIVQDNIQTIQLPKESNLVNFSILNDWRTDILFRSFSIKYVLEGCEKYVIDGSSYKIKKGEYLLANNLTGGNLTIESNTHVKGICIDISPKIIAEAALAFKNPTIILDQTETENFFCGNLYPENKYEINNNLLSKKLKEISAIISKNPHYNFEFTNEFFFEMATSLITDQHLFSHQILNIKAQKNQTKKEIFKKLLKAKNHIDTNFLTLQNVEEIALFSNMSEFHFFRLFKEVFKTSPYQYLNEKKLEYASYLLKNSTQSITEIAFKTGFCDLPTFSKCFKKNIGISPVSYKNSRN